MIATGGLIARGGSRTARSRSSRPCTDLAAAAISCRSAFSAAAWISEKLGNGWIVSRSTSSGTRARIASVACCSHSPASGPSAYAPVRSSPSLSSVRNPFDSA